MKFISSVQVFEWLSDFINLERGQAVKSFRLDRMEFLAELAGNPHRCAPSIHIAGSKGKGSVTGMLAAILSAAGFRAARYMSPHVVDIRERICLGDKYFDEGIYCAAGDELRELTEVKLPAANNPLFDPSREDGCEPTFFELLTLFFFLCARAGNCNAMIVETGMGGRLDSTNILDPLASVITLIELEHTSFLGNTITQVAGEKAGIIKQNRPLILAKQCKEALGVFREKALEMNSALLYFPEIAELYDVDVVPSGTSFGVKVGSGFFHTEFTGNTGDTEEDGGEGHRILISSSSPPCLRASVPPCEIFPSIKIPIPGKVQAENAALAMTAVKTAFPQVTEDDIRKGLENLNLPGRFEKICDEPPFIIDGAHTQESLELCIETFCSLYGEGGILLFGCAADKDASAMARAVCGHFSKIIITTPGTFKISNPKLAYEAFAAIEGDKVQLVENTKEAFLLAISGKQTPILGTGSFYLASELRQVINK